MKNFFRTIGAFFGIGIATGAFNGQIIPRNEPPKRLKSEVLPESMRRVRQAARDEQNKRALELRMKRYGLQKFTDGVNIVYARNESNGMRKLRNLQSV